MTIHRIIQKLTIVGHICNRKALFLVYGLILVHTDILATENFSEINNALFNTPHMLLITRPGRLNYQYRKTAINAADKTGNVSVEITAIVENGVSDQVYYFLGADNTGPAQQRKQVTGNAIFMLFLEQDIHEMERQTGGSWRHFQRRIRWAMAAGAQKKEVIINYQNKKVKATQYTIQPYVNDDNIERYGIYLNKYYIFTLSDQIPGTIYQVRTIVPATGNVWNEGQGSLIDERITFTGFSESLIK